MAPENNSWVREYRKLLDWPLFRVPTTAHLWEYCRLKATYRPHREVIGTVVVNLQAGQFVFGRRIAADATGLSEQEVRTALKHLIREGCLFLTSHPTNLFSIASVCNWERYQGNGDDSNQPINQPPTNLQPTSNQPLVDVGEGRAISGDPTRVKQQPTPGCTKMPSPQGLMNGQSSNLTTNKNVKKREEGEEEEETDLPAVAGGGVSENSDSEKPPRKKPAGKPKADAPPVEPKPREKNPYWDAVCAIWGFKPVTRKDAKRVGDLARDFRLKCEAADVGSDEIEVRRDILAERFQGKDKATPDAVLKWWDSADPDEIDPYAPVPAYEDAGGNWHIGYTPPSPEEEARILAEAKAEFDALPPEERAFARMKYEAQMAWKAAGKPGNAPEAYMHWPKPKAGEAENG